MNKDIFLIGGIGIVCFAVLYFSFKLVFAYIYKVQNNFRLLAQKYQLEATIPTVGEWLFSNNYPTAAGNYEGNLLQLVTDSVPFGHQGKKMETTVSMELTTSVDFYFSICPEYVQKDPLANTAQPIVTIKNTTLQAYKITTTNKAAMQQLLGNSLIVKGLEETTLLGSLYLDQKMLHYYMANAITDESIRQHTERVIGLMKTLVVEIEGHENLTI